MSRSKRYAGVSGVPLSVAVFLASDNYDHNLDPLSFSATTLLRSTRQIVLTRREEANFVQTDLVSMTASRIGSAIHDGIERAWTENYKQAMLELGIPQKMIDKVRINPDPASVLADEFPIYLEQRYTKKVGKYTVNGKFDIVLNGRVEDFKTTSVFSAMSGNNEAKHAMQGSIYAWLAPDIIKDENMAIQYMFTDWSSMRAKTEKDYPKTRHMEKIIKLHPLGYTEAFVVGKLNEIEKYLEAPEPEIPFCTDEELWRSEPVFKYYKNPQKLTRSTRNFKTKQEAHARMAEDNYVGTVIEVPGQAIACRYCAAFSLCSQKDQLLAAGDLIL